MQMPNEIEGLTAADLMRSSLRDNEDFKLYGFVKEINGLCFENLNQLLKYFKQTI